MDLLKLLREEHSKKQTDRIVNYIGDDKQRFAILMKLFFKGEYRITQRAAPSPSPGIPSGSCRIPASPKDFTAVS